MGDELTVHVTNVEQTRDMIHGFGLIEHNINMVMDPGETKTFHIKLTKPGVPVLLHELLLRAAPGDAGLSGGEQCGPAIAGRGLPKPAARRQRRRDASDSSEMRSDPKSRLEEADSFQPR